MDIEKLRQFLNNLFVKKCQKCNKRKGTKNKQLCPKEQSLGYVYLCNCCDKCKCKPVGVPEMIETVTGEITKVSHNELFQLDYPVGEFISTNILGISKYIEILKKEFVQSNKKEIVLVGAGSSGALIGGIICPAFRQFKIDIKYCAIGTKSKHRFDAPRLSRDITIFYAIVDDFIASGSTINEILSKYHYITFDLIIVSGKVWKLEERVTKTNYKKIYAQEFR